jgi:hypothetical protein
MEFLKELGSLVEARWREENYNEDVFPEIAAQTLTEAGLHEKVDTSDIVRWLFTSTPLPRQVDPEAQFGNPPVTLYFGPRFHISVYYWLDGTTSIHQHGFAGAFQVLLGSSIHSHYSFATERQINAHFHTGRLTLNSTRLLNRGDVQKILPGSQYIHSLFHLDRPSATLIIRTHRSPRDLPQFSYLRPHIAFDPFLKEETITKRAQGVELLLDIAHPKSDALISELLSGCDFQMAFVVLEAVFKHHSKATQRGPRALPPEEDRFQSLFNVVRRKHGALADYLPPVFQEQRRQQDIVDCRARIVSKEQRFFLALLLNVPERRMILELVKQKFPEQDPVSVLVDRAAELSTLGAAGDGGSNILGMDDFDDDHLFVYQCLLEGLTTRQVRDRLRAEYAPPDAERIETRLAAIRSSLEGSILLNGGSA